MNKVIVCTALALAVGITSAEAKGCIKGAVVGGVAGHAAHHAVLSGGLDSLNRISASISGTSAGIRLPRGAAAW